MIIVDSHQDLAWNMHTFNRDYSQSVEYTRRMEMNTLIAKHNGDTLLGWQEFQQGQVAIIFATLFASPIRSQKGDWDIICYADADQARSLYRHQLDAYHRLAGDQNEKFRLVKTQSDLQEILSMWGFPELQPEQPIQPPVGLVILIEGAECIRDPIELEEWWNRGVRLIGPAWAGNIYCGGTKEPGPLTSEGYALLEVMSSLGFGLDLSHMDEISAIQALDFFDGQILATHGNVHALLKDSQINRHLTDRVIQGIIERDGVIGIIPLNDFLKTGWKKGDSREEVTLQIVVNHIDYVCQIAGDALHVGIGSDFDGGFGVQSTPIELDTIADLQKLVPLLSGRGFSDNDIFAIMGGNWITQLEKILPEII